MPSPAKTSPTAARSTDQWVGRRHVTISGWFVTIHERAGHSPTLSTRRLSTVEVAGWTICVRTDKTPFGEGLARSMISWTCSRAPIASWLLAEACQTDRHQTGSFLEGRASNYLSHNEDTNTAAWAAGESTGRLVAPGRRFSDRADKIVQLHRVPSGTMATPACWTAGRPPSACRSPTPLSLCRSS